MAIRYNPTNGQYEDDDTPPIDPSLGTLSPGLADAITPPAPAVPVPEVPEPTAGAPEEAAAPSAPDAEDEATLPVASTPAIPGAAPGLGVASQTFTAPSVTTTSKVITPDIVRADKDVADAVKRRKAAFDQEEKNALERARLEGEQLKLEATRKENEATEARRAIEDANRRRAELEAQAARDQQGYQAQASKNAAGFFKDKSDQGGGNFATRLLWGMSLFFGAKAVKDGGENQGARLLDQTLSDWSQANQRELDRLGKQAERSGGRLGSFWADYAAEYQAQKALKDAAGYAHVAAQLRQLVADRQQLLSAEAKTAALSKAAAYDEQAAQDRQRAVDARASTRTQNSGGQVTTLKVPTLPKASTAAADKARAETLLDLEGNVVGRALTPEEGKKLREAQAATNGFLGTIGDLKDFTAKNGTRLLDPSLIQKRDLLVGQATAFLTQAFQTGTLQDKEFGRYKDMLSGSWLQDPKGASKGLDTLSSGMRNVYNAKLASQGVRVAGAAAPAAAAGVRQTRRIGGQLVNGVLLPNGSFQAD